MVKKYNTKHKKSANYYADGDWLQLLSNLSGAANVGTSNQGGSALAINAMTNPYTPNEKDMTALKDWFGQRQDMRNAWREANDVARQNGTATQSWSDYATENGFKGMSSGASNALFGMIGSGVTTLGNTMETIDNLLTKERPPLEETIGLYANGGSLLGTAGALALNGFQQAQIINTDSANQGIINYGNKQFDVSNNDALMSAWNQSPSLNYVTSKDLRNKSIFGDAANAISAIGTGLSGGAMIGAPIIGGTIGLASSAIGSAIGRVRAANESKRMNNRIDAATARRFGSLANLGTNIGLNNNLAMQSTYSALGGPLFTNGGIFDNGVTYINEGASHELNPNGGVQMGVDPEGAPNFVEEGEVVWNDYVFSNRLQVPKAVRNKYKLRETKDLTYADAAKKALKESDERPNDPISKNGKDAILSALRDSQEEVRAIEKAKEAQEQFNQLSPEEQMSLMEMAQQQGAPQMAAFGGQLYNKFDDGGDILRQYFSLLTPEERDEFVRENYKELPDWLFNYIAAIGMENDKGPNETLEHYLQRYTTGRYGDAYRSDPRYIEILKKSYNGEDLTGYNDIFEKEFLNYKNGSKKYYLKKLPRLNNEAAIKDIAGLLDVAANNFSIDDVDQDWIDKYSAKQLRDKINADKKTFKDKEPKESKVRESKDRDAERLARLTDKYNSYLTKYGIDPASLSKYSRDNDIRRIISQAARTQWETERNAYLKQQEDDYIAKAKATWKSKNLDAKLPEDTNWLEGYTPNAAGFGEFKDPFDEGINLDNMARYAPVLGSAIGVAQNLLNKSDYSNANRIQGVVDSLQPIGFSPLGDYMTYTPFDRNYYTNMLNAQSGATRRAIIDQSAGNRAMAMTGLLASDFTAQSKLGELARQAEEYNLAQRQAVSQFNKNTNQFNSEMGLKAAMANQQNDELRLRGTTQIAAMRDAIDQSRASALSQNLSGLFQNMGNVGVDALNRDMTNFVIANGGLDGLSVKDGKIVMGIPRAKGGKLRRRKKDLI